MVFDKKTHEFLADFRSHFAENAQKIFEQTYLRPFDGTSKVNLYDGTVERISHGVQHVSRVAVNIIILINFFKKLGYPKELIELSQDEITLLQLAALFHDAARKNDRDKDIWEKESAELFKAYLKEHSITDEKALAFANYITRTQDDWLNKLLQSADSIDIMRTKKELQLERVSLFNILKSFAHREEFIALVKECQALILNQHDAKAPCAITLNSKEISPAANSTRKQDRPELKAQYEQASLGYQKIIDDLPKFSKLSQYYRGTEPIESHRDGKQEEVEINWDVLFNDSENVFFQSNNLVFEFKSLQEVLAFQEELKKLIHYLPPILPQNKANKIHLELNPSQWQYLRAQIRAQAPLNPPKNDFVFKSIRGDKFNYFRRFIKMITPPFKKFPLRTGKKRDFTVTGEGVFQRPTASNKASKTSPAPVKKPQFKAEVKQGFSKFQPATLGMPDFYPLVFGGFDKRNNKSVGVLLDVKDVLFSDRLYTYDGGTVGRPYDFDDFFSADLYFKNKSGNVLFSQAKLDEFKKQIKDKNNAGKYNEVLARLRWNLDGTSKVFINSDTLEARLLAIEYARIIKAHLKQQGLCRDDYIVPICFYMPNSPSLNFKEYTRIEQGMDKIEAARVYASDPHTHYQNNDYEFLLALPPKKLAFAFEKQVIEILNQGYTHIFQSIIEIAPQIPWRDILKTKQTYIGILIIHNVITNEEDELGAFLLPLFLTAYKTNPTTNDNIVRLAFLAAEKGLEKCLAEFTRNSLPINTENDENENIVLVAANYGHMGVADNLLKQYRLDIDKTFFRAAQKGYKELLEMMLLRHRTRININKSYDGLTPLMIAVKYGHTDIVAALLLEKDIKCNLTDKNSDSAFMHAIKYHQMDIIKVMLTCRHIDVNQQNYDDETVLHKAVNLRDNAMIKLLFTSTAININLRNTSNYSAFDLAIQEFMRVSKVHYETEGYKKSCHECVSLFLKRKDLQIDLNNPNDIESVKFAFNNGFRNEIRSLLLSYIKGYQHKRSAQGQYVHWYGKLFGVDKEKKLAAADYLLKSLEKNIPFDNLEIEKHREALKEGELGKIFSILHK